MRLIQQQENKHEKWLECLDILAEVSRPLVLLQFLQATEMKIVALPQTQLKKTSETPK
ncbi:unnamed protein product [Toxocara canis]|uniref:Uncharacterized protein n=1 Tax=Toxocara canis TaxID=6265 RepID=A0A183TWU3_TOXCA|nr:unnamed protein product [Toxocara canis]